MPLALHNLQGPITAAALIVRVLFAESIAIESSVPRLPDAPFISRREARGFCKRIRSFWCCHGRRRRWCSAFQSRKRAAFSGLEKWSKFSGFLSHRA